MISLRGKSKRDMRGRLAHSVLPVTVLLLPYVFKKSNPSLAREQSLSERHSLSKEGESLTSVLKCVVRTFPPGRAETRDRIRSKKRNKDREIRYRTRPPTGG
jgi:hypothetical protein